MGRLERHDILFEPVQIGPKTLRNRFYQVPHCTGFGVEKPWTQAAFRGMKAEGGWAAVCTEYCSISAETDEFAVRLGPALGRRGRARPAADDRRGPRHGALAGVELWHGGLYAEARESRLPPLAPSQLSSDFDGITVPRAMDIADIRRVQEEWVAAARRARDAGFDIVYVYGSHTYLPTQFLSPVYNRRSDDYGGPFESRAGSGSRRSSASARRWEATARSRCGSPPTRWRGRASSSRRASSSSAARTRWSTCGT